jgi:hypothetical protein
VTRRVLVIDDDARVRTALCALLVSSTDLVPTEAATAADAGAAAFLDKDGRPDLLLAAVRATATPTRRSTR